MTENVSKISFEYAAGRVGRKMSEIALTQDICTKICLQKSHMIEKSVMNVSIITMN